MIPFIKKYHKIESLIFWADLAMIHKAKIVRAEIEKNVSLVLKDENPPNVRHLCPIQKFWALCKRAYSNLRKNTGYFKKIQVPVEEN